MGMGLSLFNDSRKTSKWCFGLSMLKVNSKPSRKPATTSRKRANPRTVTLMVTTARVPSKNFVRQPLSLSSICPTAPLWVKPCKEADCHAEAISRLCKAVFRNPGPVLLDECHKIDSHITFLFIGGLFSNFERMLLCSWAFFGEKIS